METTYNARAQATQIEDRAGTNGAAHLTVMSYDGHARLRARHVPEQEGDTGTTYSYNADDTVNTVTDARGATATYSYNNRHLATNINYGAPAGVVAAPAVAFGYDEAGNRTSMTTDGGAGGSLTYLYDTLSQLIAETRQLPGLAGSYTLSYEYTLSGALKKVSDLLCAGRAHYHGVQPQGERVNSNVWPGTEMLARRASGTLLWQHLNPVTREARETSASGQVVTETHEKDLT